MISFVGAGPGAADLITVRGASRLAKADVVVWASSLVPEAVLEHCRPGVEVHDSATMTLEDVIDVYAAADEATPIVRLHSGDPSLYGAIGEQIDWCVAQERSFEVVPGVSSVAAAAASLARELTVPGVSQSVVLTRLAGRTAASMPGREGVAAFASHGATMAVFLSAARPDELAAELLAPGSGYGPDTPAAIVVRASWPDETIVRTTVARLTGDLRATGATMTVLVLVGEALAARPVARRSHLYEPSYTTAYRLRSAAGSTEGRPSARRSDRREPAATGGPTDRPPPASVPDSRKPVATAGSTESHPSPSVADGREPVATAGSTEGHPSPSVADGRERVTAAGPPTGDGSPDPGDHHGGRQ